MSLGLLLFLLLLAIIVVFERKKFKREGIAFLRRSTRGVKVIEKYGKEYKGWWELFADAGIVLSLGFLGSWILNRYGIKKKKIAILTTLYLLVYIIFILHLGIIENAMSQFHLSSFHSVVILTYLSSLFFGISGYSFGLVLLGGISNFIHQIMGMKDVAPTLQLVLPFSLPSNAVPVLTIPFDKWLIALTIIVVVHEFSHAFVAASQNIRIKSIGYGILAILPVGFAEPDEESMRKSSALSRLRVYSAGSMANLLTALFFFLLFLIFSLVFSPLFSHVYVFKGISYDGLANNTYSREILPINGTITEINGNRLENFSMFITTLLRYHPNESIILTINDKNYTVRLSPHPQNASLPFIGVLNVKAEYVMREDIGVITKTFVLILQYLLSLIKWIVLLNVGIAIANLIPMIPLDGGLMIKEIFESHRIVYLLISLLSLIGLILALFSKLILSIF